MCSGRYSDEEGGPLTTIVSACSRRMTPSTSARPVLRALLNHWRQWDWIAAQRVDRYLTISRAAQARIKSYWRRDAKVVHPPVETSRFAPGPVGGYYMVLSELMRHKRIEVAVAAFNRLRLPLVIAGDGPDARRLLFHESWPAGIHPMVQRLNQIEWPPGGGAASGTHYSFLQVQGEGVCEVPVGPVHAGIIEPGHFRFTAGGETVVLGEYRARCSTIGRAVR